MRIQAAGLSNTGKKRLNNEDNFYFNGNYLDKINSGTAELLYASFSLKDMACFGVFDGLGGEEFGEVASYTAVKTLGARLRSRQYNHMTVDEMESICRQMNMSVCEESVKADSRRMGSTVAMICIYGREVCLCNIGDSRIFLLRNQKLTQVSRDHLEPTFGDAAIRKKPRLTQHLGVFPDELTLEPYVVIEKANRNDMYLLSSDGITDMVSEDELLRCLSNSSNIKKQVTELVELALANGGRDNITAIIVKIQ